MEESLGLCGLVPSQYGAVSGGAGESRKSLMWLSPVHRERATLALEMLSKTVWMGSTLAIHTRFW